MIDSFGENKFPCSGELGWGSGVRNKEGRNILIISLSEDHPSHFIFQINSSLSRAYAQKSTQTLNELLMSYCKVNTPMYPPPRSRNRILPAPRALLPPLHTTTSLLLLKGTTLLTCNLSSFYIDTSLTVYSSTVFYLYTFS